MMKKIWEKPKLIILLRGRPEELVLAGCKMAGNTITYSTKNNGCMTTNNCKLCSVVSAS